MRILITGNMGYVGPVLAGYLRRNMPDSTLLGFDTGYFGHVLTNPGRLPEAALDIQYIGDVREMPAARLDGVDAVVQLSAISNDPMGTRYEAVTDAVNHKASVRVAELARNAGVKAFVFASSCSMYGAAEGGARKETDGLNPLTAYARSKAAVEAALAAFDPGSMTVTCLRFATACGMSPRLRLDLVLNDFVACALTAGRITVLSDGSPWRPLIDVEDMARAIHWAIGRNTVDGGQKLSVNVGANRANYQVRDLAQAVAAAVPGTGVEINRDAPPDKRSYKVDFSLLESLAPRQFLPQVSLESSIANLAQGLGQMGLAATNFRESDFMRLKVLEQHVAAGRLTGDLRWTTDGTSDGRRAAA